MFGKPKIRTAEELLRLLDELPEEEKNKVLSALEHSDEGAETPAEPAPEAETPAEESAPPAEGAEAPAPAEPAAEEEDEQPAAEEPAADRGEAEEIAEPAAEAETPETDGNEAEVKDDEQDRYEALTARILALEEQFAAMKESQADAVAAEESKDFGSAPSAPQGDVGEDRYSAVMRAYAGDKAKNYG